MRSEGEGVIPKNPKVSNMSGINGGGLETVKKGRGGWDGGEI